MRHHIKFKPPIRARYNGQRCFLNEVAGNVRDGIKAHITVYGEPATVKYFDMQSIENKETTVVETWSD